MKKGAFKKTNNGEIINSVQHGGETEDEKIHKEVQCAARQINSIATRHVFMNETTVSDALLLLAVQRYPASKPVFEVLLHYIGIEKRFSVSKPDSTGKTFIDYAINHYLTTSNPILIEYLFDYRQAWGTKFSDDQATTIVKKMVHIIIDQNSLASDDINKMQNAVKKFDSDMFDITNPIKNPNIKIELNGTLVVTAGKNREEVTFILSELKTFYPIVKPNKKNREIASLFVKMIDEKVVRMKHLREAIRKLYQEGSGHQFSLNGYERDGISVGRSLTKFFCTRRKIAKRALTNNIYQSMREFVLQSISPYIYEDFEQLLKIHNAPTSKGDDQVQLPGNKLLSQMILNQTKNNLGLTDKQRQDFKTSILDLTGQYKEAAEYVKLYFITFKAYIEYCQESMESSIDESLPGLVVRHCAMNAFKEWQSIDDFIKKLDALYPEDKSKKTFSQQAQPAEDNIDESNPLAAESNNTQDAYDEETKVDKEETTHKFQQANDSILKHKQLKGDNKTKTKKNINSDNVNQLEIFNTVSNKEQKKKHESTNKNNLDASFKHSKGKDKNIHFFNKKPNCKELSEQEKKEDVKKFHDFNEITLNIEQQLAILKGSSVLKNSKLQRVRNELKAIWKDEKHNDGNVNFYVICPDGTKKMNNSHGIMHPKPDGTIVQGSTKSMIDMLEELRIQYLIEQIKLRDKYKDEDLFLETPSMQEVRNQYIDEHTSREALSM